MRSDRSNEAPARVRLAYLRIIGRDPHWVRFARFLVVGALNTLFAFAVYMSVLRLSGSYVVGVIVANIIGPLFNFVTTGRLVFSSTRIASLLPFLCGYAVICLLNIATVRGLAVGGIGPIWGQALCLPILVVTSYMINSKFVFGARG